MVQAHIFFSGTVQGVGFRYTTLQYATALKLKGWVKNLPDGRVEILVEGPKESLEKFYKKLEEHFSGYIHHKSIDFLEPYRQFKDFEITH